MTTPPDVVRKVRQLDNDVQSIYEMLARIEATQNRHGNRLAEVATAVSEVTTAVSEVAAAVSDLDGKATETDGKLNRIIQLLEQR
jgi:uncharacterized protein YoxC